MDNSFFLSPKGQRSCSAAQQHWYDSGHLGFAQGNFSRTHASWWRTRNVQRKHHKVSESNTQHFRYPGFPSTSLSCRNKPLCGMVSVHLPSLLIAYCACTIMDSGAAANGHLPAWNIQYYEMFCMSCIIFQNATFSSAFLRLPQTSCSYLSIHC